MRMTKMIAAVAAMAMMSSTAMAQTANTNNTVSATKLSLNKNVRASSSTDRGNNLADGPSTITALFLGGLVVAGIIVAITNGDDDDAPVSP